MGNPDPGREGVDPWACQWECVSRWVDGEPPGGWGVSESLSNLAL